MGLPVVDNRFRYQQLLTPIKFSFLIVFCNSGFWCPPRKSLVLEWARIKPLWQVAVPGSGGLLGTPPSSLPASINGEQKEKKFDSGSGFSYHLPYRQQTHKQSDGGIRFSLERKHMLEE
jgi:hypothetical protein